MMSFFIYYGSKFVHKLPIFSELLEHVLMGHFFPLRAEKKKVPVIVTAGERFLAEDHSSARPSRQDKTLVFGQLCSYTPGEPINDTS